VETVAGNVWKWPGANVGHVAWKGPGANMGRVALPPSKRPLDVRTAAGAAGDTWQRRTHAATLAPERKAAALGVRQIGGHGCIPHDRRADPPVAHGCTGRHAGEGHRHAHERHANLRRHNRRRHEVLHHSSTCWEFRRLRARLRSAAGLLAALASLVAMTLRQLCDPVCR
jgi:hypothetical protein